MIHDPLAAAKLQLKSEGWCVLPDVLDSGRAAQVLSQLWLAAEESRRRGGATFMPALDPNQSNIRVFHLLELDPIFQELIQNPIAIEMVHSILGESFLISNFTANIARPGSRSMALHSDQSLVVPEPWLQPWSLNIIWCLTDVSFDNGGTLFVPGSHRWETRNDIPPDVRTRFRSFEAKAGSIIAMEGRLWHTSGANITPDQDRAMLFGYYTKPFLRPQVNWNACLSPETQSMLAPRMRDWLGLGISANAGGVADLRYLEDQFAPQEEPA